MLCLGYNPQRSYLCTPCLLLLPEPPSPMGASRVSTGRGNQTGHQAVAPQSDDVHLLTLGWELRGSRAREATAGCGVGVSSSGERDPSREDGGDPGSLQRPRPSETPPAHPVCRAGPQVFPRAGIGPSPALWVEGGGRTLVTGLWVGAAEP